MAYRILFLCVANSARSQMAEGLARAILGPGVEVASAGSSPTAVHPLAIEAMAEVGIDIAHHLSKSVTDAELRVADAVITLCADEICPLLPAGVKRLHWLIDDPAPRQQGEDHDRQLDRFRRARDLIRDRIEHLPRGQA